MRQRHDLGPGLELLEVIGVAGDKALLHAGRPHDPPLVVVAAEPDLGDVLELPVLRDVLGRQVAVVVEDRHLAGVLVVQPLRGLAAQQEILSHELHR